MSKIDQQAAREVFKDEILLWQDFSEPESFYRAKLIMQVHRDGRRTLQLSSGGTVVNLPYVFGYSEKDKL